MKAVILLGTLKSTGLSNTETLVEFHNRYLSQLGVECETIKLVNENILPGTYIDMGHGDNWPTIVEKLKLADIVIFATPVWWGNHSSEIQKAIERLDEIHDMLSEGTESILDNKAGGIIVTGDSDGAQNIIGNISNFFNAVGVTIPAYCTLKVLSKDHEKDSEAGREKLIEKYEKYYAETAAAMAKALVNFAKNSARK